LLEKTGSAISLKIFFLITFSVYHYLIYFLYILGADSLAYLSVEGLVQAVRHKIADKDEPHIGHCTACLTGEYPEKLQW